MKKYWRGSNNPHEPNLIASGKIKSSFNHLTGKEEAGLSVSVKIDNLLEHFCILCRVTGNEIGYGSDGEILLDPSSVRLHQ